jgi:plasmid stabilization system protein ParE
MMRIKVSRDARRELKEAANWYDDRKLGLGDEFVAACDQLFKLIAANPGRHMHVGRGFHRCLMPRFPYVVFYEPKRDALIIAGVIHGSRNPAFWRQRLGLD